MKKDKTDATQLSLFGDEPVPKPPTAKKPQRYMNESLRKSKESTKLGRKTDNVPLQ